MKYVIIRRENNILEQMEEFITKYGQPLQYTISSIDFPKSGKTLKKHITVKSYFDKHDISSVTMRYHDEKMIVIAKQFIILYGFSSEGKEGSFIEAVNEAYNMKR